MDKAGRKFDAGGEASPEERRSWEALYRIQDTAAEYDRRFRRGPRSWNNRWIWRAVAAELRRTAGGSWPARVIDAPAGTGRFTRQLREAGVKVVHVDRSRLMLATLRKRHGQGWEVLGDLRRPPLLPAPGSVALCLRLMQHLNREERVAALEGLRLLAPTAVVAYYPGWHLKSLGRRIRHRTGLPHRTLRESNGRSAIAAETEQAGWNLLRIHPVLPLLSENVLLVLEAKE